MQVTSSIRKPILCFFNDLYRLMDKIKLNAFIGKRVLTITILFTKYRSTELNKFRANIFKKLSTLTKRLVNQVNMFALHISS